MPGIRRGESTIIELYSDSTAAELRISYDRGKWVIEQAHEWEADGSPTGWKVMRRLRGWPESVRTRGYQPPAVVSSKPLVPPVGRGPWED